MGKKNITKYWFETKLSEGMGRSLAFDQPASAATDLNLPSQIYKSRYCQGMQQTQPEGDKSVPSLEQNKM